jgi:hypothetical protein
MVDYFAGPLPKTQLRRVGIRRAIATETSEIAAIVSRGVSFIQFVLDQIPIPHIQNQNHYLTLSD